LLAQEKKLKSGMEKWRDRNQQSLCFREPNTLSCLLVATIFSLARQKIEKETKTKNKNLGHTNPTEKQTTTSKSIWYVPFMHYYSQNPSII
jgi:hypothetical protein